MTPIRLCLLGADGRMGQEIIRTMDPGFSLSGAITHRGSPNEGKTLGDLNLPHPEVMITGPETMNAILAKSDVYVSFTTPEAEAVNVPIAAGMGKKIVMGTTGLSSAQMVAVWSAIEGKTEAVVASNFSVGINFIGGLLSKIKHLPASYDVSLTEIHHTGKMDSPSGTAIYLSEIIKSARGYSKDVHGRDGKGRRAPDEMEIVSIRAGGVPGVHDIVIAGPNEMIKIEHTAFSRRVFAEGALLSARWLMGVNDRKVHSMRDVLGV